MGIPLKQFLPEEIEFPDWEKLAEYAAGLAPVVPNLAGTTWVGLEDGDAELAFAFGSDGAIKRTADIPFDESLKGSWTVSSNVVQIKFEDERGWMKYRGVIEGDTIRGKGEGRKTWKFSVTKVG
jgi:hypothetical protein